MAPDPPMCSFRTYTRLQMVPGKFLAHPRRTRLFGGKPGDHLQPLPCGSQHAGLEFWGRFLAKRWFSSSGLHGLAHPQCSNVPNTGFHPSACTWPQHHPLAESWKGKCPWSSRNEGAGIIQVPLVRPKTDLNRAPSLESG